MPIDPQFLPVCATARDIQVAAQAHAFSAAFCCCRRHDSYIPILLPPVDDCLFTARVCKFGVVFSERRKVSGQKSYALNPMLMLLRLPV